MYSLYNIGESAKSISREAKNLASTLRPADRLNAQVVQDLANRIVAICNESIQAYGEDGNDSLARRIYSLVAESGAKGVSKFDLTSQTQSTTALLRDSAIGRLIESGEIAEERIATGTAGRPKTVYRITSIGK